MRILVLFDLPMVEKEDKRVYAAFRKYLIHCGFMMMQESVYCKMVVNAVVGESVMRNLRNNCPDRGLVQMLAVTEKQYSKMQVLVGEAHDEVLNTDERLVFL